MKWTSRWISLNSCVCVCDPVLVFNGRWRCQGSYILDNTWQQMLMLCDRLTSEDLRHNRSPLAFGILTDGEMGKGCLLYSYEVCQRSLWEWFLSWDAEVIMTSVCGGSGYKCAENLQSRNEIGFIWPTRAPVPRGHDKEGKKYGITAGNQSLTPPIRQKD